MASWSPASFPTKEVDYFGSKNLFFSLLHARLAAEVLWTFPSFFVVVVFLLKAVLSLLWYISFALICLWSPPLWLIK